MTYRQSRLTVSAILVLTGSLGIVVLSKCAQPDDGSRHSEVNGDTDPSHIDEVTVPMFVRSVHPRGNGNTRSIVSGPEFRRLMNAQSQLEDVQAGKRMGTESMTVAVVQEGLSDRSQPALVRQMIEDSLKRMGIDGVVAVPQNLTTADMQNIMKQADAVLEHRRNQARIAAARQNLENAVLYERQIATHLDTTTSLGNELSRPTYMPLQYLYPRLGGMDNLGWYDEAAAARHDALLMYDYQMSGSMGWTGYAVDIDE